MKVSRETTWWSFEQKWCPQCGKVTEMEPIRTGLPGIAAQKCKECGMNWQANFIEDGQDVMECPDNFTFAPGMPCGL